ncbi:MAG: antirestriction protein ArdA [Pseudomonadota bacterium]
MDGERIDCELAQAFHLYQSNIADFFEIVERWDDDDKINFIIAVGECSYDFDVRTDNVKELDIYVYEVSSLTELAEQLLYEGLIGEIPGHLECYLDLDKIARDLSVDYAMTDVAGRRFAYRCE